MRRSAENAGRKRLAPVPMYFFWGEVLRELNGKLKAQYRYPYVSEVYKGQKRNAEVEEVIDGCVEKTLRDFEARGLRPVNQVLRREAA